MNTATIILTLIRLAGLTQITLGILFWSGNARHLIPIHVLVGMVLILLLWTLAILAARASVSLGFVALTVGWGLIVPLRLLVPILGITPVHWVIQVFHLLVGLGAIGLAGRLATQIQRQRTLTPQTAIAQES